MTERWSAPSTEREARIELAAAYRMAHDLGWTDLGATHFSLAVPGEPDAYLMLRAGLFFDEVTASNLVKVSVDGDVRDHGDVALALVNPAGVTIHSAVHEGRPDVQSVMHTHSPAGVAVSCHPDAMLPLSQHSMRFYEGHGIHGYEGVALDEDEGPRLALDLGDHELLVLRNHGLLTVGCDVPSAFSALYYAEMAAEMQVAALAGTHEPVTPPHDVCAHTRKQFDASSGYMYRDWQGVLRHVRRNHPDFAD
ncbi:MAG: class II aldolase/adducin family protein [Acidimicrobiales bacterium]